MDYFRHSDSCIILGACGYWYCNEYHRCLLASKSIQPTPERPLGKYNEYGHKIGRHARRKIKKSKRIRNKVKTQHEVLSNQDCNHPLNGKTINVFRKQKEPVFCAYCECELKFESQVTRDHLWPISKGGNSFAINKVWCCRSCNNDKGDKRLELWLFEVDQKLIHIITARARPNYYRVKHYQTIQKNISQLIDYVNENKGRLLRRGSIELTDKELSAPNLSLYPSDNS